MDPTKRCGWDDGCKDLGGLTFRDDIMGGAWVCAVHQAVFDQDMYYVISPLNTNYRAGDSGGDWSIISAPTADYYTSEDAAVAAMQALNRKDGLKNRDALDEMGAFVVKVIRWSE